MPSTVPPDISFCRSRTSLPKGGTALSIDHEAVRLPINFVSGESGELGDAKSCIKQSPHDKFVHMLHTGICKAIYFILGEWLSFVLVRHGIGDMLLIMRIAINWRTGALSPHRIVRGSP
jgi:hypothetical protein